MPREVPVCGLVNCPNSDRRKVSSTVFYFVPKDPLRSAKWVDALKGHIYGAPALTNILVCMNHFKPDAFEPDSKKLNSYAIPSIFPSPPRQTRSDLKKTTVQVRNDPPHKKCQPTKVPIPLCSKERASSQNSSLIGSETDEDYDIERDIDIKLDGFSDSEFDNTRQVEMIENLKIQKQSLMEDYNTLQKQEQEVGVELQELREEVKRKKTVQQNLPNQEKEVLKKCFSTAQIRLLMGQNKSRWSLDDLAMAYTISSLSSREFYTYLRTNLKYPLPAVSNINRCYKSKYRTKNRKNKVNVNNDESE